MRRSHIFLSTVLGCSLLLFSGCGSPSDNLSEPHSSAPMDSVAVLDAPGFVYEVRGEQFSLDQVQVLGDTPVADFFTVVGGPIGGTQLRMLPNAPGTYTVGEGPSAYRLVDIWFTHGGKRYEANATQGSGTITLTTVGNMGAEFGASHYQGLVQGSFSGTFVSADGSQIEVSNGLFYIET